ncbi:MAG: radical SAM family heme chaperone HemW [Candidatus Syntrophosphaera sp.]
MEQDLPPRPLAVYLHIPFCLSSCGYCSFFSVKYSTSGVRKYLRHQHREIDLFEKKAGFRIKARTLYLGGGTPSLLTPEQINALCGRFFLESGAEVTLEINPVQITRDFLKELANTSINRLSIGLQSMIDDELAFLGRRHRSSQMPQKIKLCREHGFDNISLDLIYGLPGTGEERLQTNMTKYLALGPEHISAYLLSLEGDTTLGRELETGKISLPDEDNLVAQYETLRLGLTAAGYEHYEISNFCRPGYASRHNITYWKNEPYLGLGASASGWLPPWRYANPPNLEQYYRIIEKNEVMPGAEECSRERIKMDYIMMGLRLLEGLDLADYRCRFGSDLYEEKSTEIEKLRELNMLEMKDDKLRLTGQALFVSNRVIGELL